MQRKKKNTYNIKDVVDERRKRIQQKQREDMNMNSKMKLVLKKTKLGDKIYDRYLDLLFLYLICNDNVMRNWKPKITVEDIQNDPIKVHSIIYAYLTDNVLLFPFKGQDPEKYIMGTLPDECFEPIDYENRRRLKIEYDEKERSYKIYKEKPLFNDDNDADFEDVMPN